MGFSDGGVGGGRESSPLIDVGGGGFDPSPDGSSGVFRGSESVVLISDVGSSKSSPPDGGGVEGEEVSVDSMSPSGSPSSLNSANHQYLAASSSLCRQKKCSPSA